MDKLDGNVPVSDNKAVTPWFFKQTVVNTVMGADVLNKRHSVTGRYVRYRAKEGSAYYYDKLEGANTDVTLLFSQRNGTLGLRDKLTDGAYITVEGFAYLNLNESSLELVLQVEQVVGFQQECYVSQDEYECYLLLREKIHRGRRDMPDMRQIRQSGRKIRVCLILPNVSVAQSDIEAGLADCRDWFQIDIFNVSFHKPEEVAALLIEKDFMDYDLMAVSRGGGSKWDLAKLDNPVLMRAIMDLRTPVVAAVGHNEDKLFIKDICDWTCPVPNNFGGWLAEQAQKESCSSDNVLQLQLQLDQMRQQFEATDKDKKQYQAWFRQKSDELIQVQDECRTLKSRMQYNRTTGKQTGKLLDGLPLLQKYPTAVQYALVFLAIVGLISLIF